MITAAVIGCGYVSRFHLRALQKIGARVRWVCDLDAERARPWVEAFQSKYSRDYGECIEDPDVNAVFVLSSAPTHKPVCLRAIGAGRAVICEKTLTDSADDSLEVVQRAQERGTIFYTCYMKRFIPAVQKAKELLPELGTLMSASFRVYQPWGDLWGEMPAEGFFHTPPGGRSVARRNYGGGILIMGGSHLLDLVNFFFGRPRRVFGSVHTPPGRDYDVRATALLETEQAPVQFEAVAHPLRHIGFLRDGWEERIEVNGTRGRLEILSALWDQFDHKTSLLVHYDNATGSAVEYRFPPVSPFERAIGFFCENIAKGTQGEQSPLTGYEVDELIAAIQRSSETGRAVDVPWRI